MTYPLNSINYKNILTNLFPNAVDTYIYEKLELVHKIGPEQFVNHLDAGNKIKWAKELENDVEVDEIYCHNKTQCGYNSYIYDGCDDWGPSEKNDKWICKKCIGDKELENKLIKP